MYEPCKLGTFFYGQPGNLYYDVIKHNEFHTSIFKNKFLWSSENGRNLNILNVSNFRQFCNYLKDNIAAESILLFCYNVIKHNKFHTSQKNSEFGLNMK